MTDMFMTDMSYFERAMRALGRHAFLQKVMGRVVSALFLTFIGASLSIAIAMPFINVWVQLALLFALLAGMQWSDHPLPCFLAFAFLEGLFLGPFFTVALAVPGGGLIILASTAIVTLIFGGVFLYLLFRGKAYSLPGGLISGLLFGLIGIGILALVTGSHSLFFLHTCIGIGVFTLCLLVDLSKALFHYGGQLSEGDEDRFATLVAAEIYLDLLTLLIMIIQAFLSSESGQDVDMSDLWSEKICTLFLTLFLIVYCVILYYFTNTAYEQSEQNLDEEEEISANADTFHDNKKEPAISTVKEGEDDTFYDDDTFYNREGVLTAINY